MRERHWSLGHNGGGSRLPFLLHPAMTRPHRPLALALLLTLTGPASAADPPNATDRVRPFLARYCLGCHGPEKPKGDFRVDRLPGDGATPASREPWEAALKRVRSGEMPPKGKPQPTAAEVEQFAAGLEARLHQITATQGRVGLRRLNRVEYENTLRDLLGIEWAVKDLLPPDSSANGFDTNSEAQHVSSFLMEQYLEAADAALAVAIANGPRPPLVKKRYRLQDERHVKTTTERVFRTPDEALILFSSSAWQAIILRQFYPPDRGRYRFRLAVSAVQSAGKPVAFRVDAGPMLMGTKDHHVGYFEAPAGQPTVIEFLDHLEARSTIRILPYGLASAQAVHKVGADQYDGPGLAVHWVEVEGPLHDTWPPESHRRLFGDLAQAPAPAPNSRARVEVTSKNPEADLERVIREFARRAFRRPVPDSALQPILKLARSRLEAGYSFEQAARVGLKAVLVSPQFLYLSEEPGPLDDHALAARLSYFLWSTMPDAELLALAEQKKLTQPQTLREQVERMLRSPKAHAFVENFVGQWLGLRDIDFTEPSHLLYPEYDHALRVAMVREAELFFAEILRDDLSLTNFIASDFSMLNGRLARHYGIPGVEGWEFRKVPLPPGSHRGGVLTMAGVLKVTANGTNTSPVLRGAWVLDRLLGTPPPRPPADIPAIEPDIRGATTIREQLAKHRQLESCASCHVKMDPPGFALESFDVIGGWREHYRTTGRGQPVVVDGRRMHYLKGPKVDPGDVLPDGRRFANIDEFKQLLLADRDQVTRSLTEKILTYATGAPPGVAGQAEVDRIVATVRAKNYGFRSLIHEVVNSRLFREK